MNLSVDDFIVGNSNRNYDDSYNFGAVCSVRHRATHCSLCRITLETVGLSEPTGLEYIESGTCELYWQAEGFVMGDELPKVRFLRVSLRSCPPSYPEFHRICLVGDDAPRGAQRLFLGRRVPNKITIDRIKSWIRSCLRWHGDECQTFVNRTDCGMPPGFRVIDTWDNYIMNKPLREYKCLALSYVWGGASSFFEAIHG